MSPSSSPNQRITIDCDLLPEFTASYLRSSKGECAFIETNTSHALPKMLGALKQANFQPDDVRWVVVTHAHLDHAAGASALLSHCPNATLLAHPRAARHLIDPSKLIASATAVYGQERFSMLYGQIDPIPAHRVKALEDGDSFELGDSTFRVLFTKGHANHHFVVHDPAMSCVYTGDTFGLVYPALQKQGRCAFPSTSPTNFDPVEARKSIKAILALGVQQVCPTHFGVYDDVDTIGEQMLTWIDRTEQWLEHSIRQGESLEAMTAWLAQQWRQAFENESKLRHLGFDENTFKHLAPDIDLNAQGIAFVADEKRRVMAEKK